MRIAWRTVGGICERVAAQAQREVDLLSGLKRIGIDEISHRTCQRYLTVVVCHDAGRLVWAAPGRDRKTVERFLDTLGEERCKEVELVSCDMASWISGPIADRLPDAVRCVDSFHVVQLATDALDEIRREAWNQARQAGDVAAAKDLKGTRYALWKNPENLTDRQKLKLTDIQKTNQRQDDHRTASRDHRRDRKRLEATRAWKRSTPRSGCSPAARSNSTAPTR